MDLEYRNILRHEVLAKRDLLSGRMRDEQSISVASYVMGMTEVCSAGTVFIYMHFRSEVQTLEMIKAMLAVNQIVSIPYTCPDPPHLVAVRVTDPDQQVSPGYCGIPEPIPELVIQSPCDPTTIDVVIVPGSVFDKSGGRLGYGGGYYDRFLITDAPEAVRIGLAFEVQMVDRVPVEAHDQFMDFVVTEKQIYDCRRNRYAQNSSLSR